MAPAKADESSARFARVCWAMCRKASDALGWDFDACGRDARAAEAVAQAHAAFWFVLELALTRATPDLTHDVPAEAAPYASLFARLDTLPSLLLLRDPEFDAQLAYAQLRSARHQGLLAMPTPPPDVASMQMSRPELAAELRAASEGIGLLLGTRLASPAVFSVLQLMLRVLLRISLEAAGFALGNGHGAATTRTAVLSPLLEALFAQFQSMDAPHEAVTPSEPRLRPAAPAPFAAEKAMGRGAAAAEPLAAHATSGRSIPPGADREPTPRPPSPSASGEPANPPRGASNDVRFTAYRPKQLRAARWDKVLAFAHRSELRTDACQSAAPIAAMQNGARSRREESGVTKVARAPGAPPPLHGEALTFVAAGNGLEFDPPRCSVRWVEDAHQVEFLVRAAAELAGCTAHAQIDVLVGDLRVARLPVALEVVDSTTTVPEIGFHACPSVLVDAAACAPMVSTTSAAVVETHFDRARFDARATAQAPTPAASRPAGRGRAEALKRSPRAVIEYDGAHPRGLLGAQHRLKALGALSSVAIAAALLLLLRAPLDQRSSASPIDAPPQGAAEATVSPADARARGQVDVFVDTRQPQDTTPDPGSVLIESVPTAETFVDGVRLGRTPLRLHRRLAGDGLLELRAPGYESRVLEHWERAGDHLRVSLDPVPAGLEAPAPQY